MKKDSAISNIFAAIGSNIISLSISITLSLFIPRLLEVEAYAYWQLYSLVISYAGFFHLGMIDGMYLKLGGIEYDDLDCILHKTIYVVFFIIKMLFLIIFIIVCLFLKLKFDNKIVLVSSGIAISLVLDYTYYSMLLEASNRIKASSKLMVIFKVSYGLLVGFLFIIGYRSYQSMIFADILSKIIVVLFSFCYCKKILVSRAENYKQAFSTMIMYTLSGLNLMLANVAGMFVTGISRFFIVGNWGLEIFGNISIAMNIANLLFVFMSTLSAVFFPILRRVGNDKMNEIYDPVRITLVVFLMCLIGTYFPLYLIFKLWLPQYVMGLEYMALLFPMVIFESKATLLLNTYLKTRSRERDIFKANILSIIVCISLSFVFTYLIKSLYMSVVSVFLVLFFKSFVLELYLTGGKYIIQNILELFLSALFVYISWNYRGWVSTSIYFIFLTLILLVQHRIVFTNIKKFIDMMLPKK